MRRRREGETKKKISRVSALANLLSKVTIYRTFFLIICALEARLEVDTLKKVVSHSVATDFANSVLPV